MNYGPKRKKHIKKYREKDICRKKREGKNEARIKNKGKELKYINKNSKITFSLKSFCWH